MADEGMILFHCRLRPRRISLFRFLLEGYDGLATLSTESAALGLVACRTPVARGREAAALLGCLCRRGILSSYLREGSGHGG
ncbi:MAG: DUF4911 domain-containing protein [Deltaproteobacteria bacterium]|nr:DUF4911 domain-containing protein [Deltaproteobacteria bacterium]